MIPKLLDHPFSRALGLILLFSVLTVSSQTSVAGNSLEIGDVPPQALGRDLDGNAISLEEFKGRPVVVSFWASWCPPCLAELEVLEQIQHQVDPEELRIIATNVLESNQRNIRRNLARHENRQLLYTFDRNNRVSRAYNIEHLPRLMMLDREGRIAHLHIGYDESFLDQMIDQINALLAAEGPAEQ